MTVRAGRITVAGAAALAILYVLMPGHAQSDEGLELASASLPPALRPDLPQATVEDRPEEAADETVEPVPDSALDRVEAGRGPVTNLPLPRYVSLKAAEGNARRGPSLSHRIDWVFHHRDMPLMVTAEFGHWRRVEDRDGAGGWVHYSLISGVRTVVFTEDKAELHMKPDARSPVMAIAELGAIGRLGECNRDWCRISAGGEKGWIEKTRIWGVDRDETRD